MHAIRFSRVENNVLKKISSHIMNIIKKFMDSGLKQELMMIPSGQFALLRSKKSPKASLECIYNDATLSIRQVGKYAYELVVRKIADDAEVSNGDGSEEYSDDSVSVLSVQSKKKDDEWAFALSEMIGFHKKWNKQGDMAFVWNNTVGDEEDENVQFVVTPDISLHDIDQFLQTIHRCEYETKYKESSSNATNDDLEKIAAKSVFMSIDDSDLGVDDVHDEKHYSSEELMDKLRNLKVEDASFHESDLDDFQDAREAPDNDKTAPKNDSEILPLNSAPSGERLCLLKSEFFVFDPAQEQFILQKNDVKVAVIETGDYEYWLAVGGDSLSLGTDLSPNINPTFDLRKNSFIFNYSFNSITLSYMLVFENTSSCVTFQALISKCLWMSLNKKPWSKVPDNEKKYILGSSTLVERELSDILSNDDDVRDHSASDSSDDEDEEEYSTSVLSSESYGESDRQRPKSQGNRSLTVAYKNNRSYVVRGDKIGVFKTDEDGLDFVTAIRNVSDLKGKRIDPQNPMLYMEDRALIMRDGKDENKIFKMDLERGKVIEEWSTSEKNVVQFGPAKKFDQLIPEQTVLGISKKGLFKIDPRINASDKVVQDQSKEYATNCKFSSFGTTENGYIAVGSENGDVRLYDRLGIRAKTAIPSLGQPIRHICISANGKWLLCTCDSSLLLMDLTVKTGKNSGNISFLKPFPANENVKTYILKIRPEHASYIATSTKKAIKFTKAYFNTGLGKEEQTIVTSTGPFAVSWSLKKVLKGDTKPYLMKRYDADVIEDNFEFGTDRKVIVALKDDVSISKIKSFKTPDKQIMAPDINLFYNDEDESENLLLKK